MRNCFCCSQSITSIPENINPEDVVGYNEFNAFGNYGSTSFDPDPMVIRGRKQQLSIVVCDNCLQAKAAEGLVDLLTVQSVDPVVTRSKFNPVEHPDE